MNDLEILQQIHEELKNVDHPPFDPLLIELYGKLVDRVREEGFQLLVADAELTENVEQALRQLNRWEYVDAELKHHGSDGFIYHVDLRSKRFFELAEAQPKSVDGMNDSGKRETFSTGAVRDSAEGKPRPELISPFAMERLSEWLRKGAEKYAPRNWEKGIPLSRCTASLCRHLLKFQQGCTDEDHVAAIICNGMFIAHIQEMCQRGVLPETLLDMPDYNAKPSCHDNGDVPLDYEPEEEFRWKAIHENS